MKVLIVEDEPLAAEQLENMILTYESHFEVVAKLDSIESSIHWLKNNPLPDLAFFDIQLADGLSFRIFEETQLEIPVVFTTAYDEYALKAFQVNSIDYLLKPIAYESLAKAIDKYARLFLSPQTQATATVDVATIKAVVDSIRKPKKYKSRFVVKRGEHLVSVPTSEILYFYSEDKFTFLKTHEEQRYIIDFTLAELDSQLDPERFFRVNRQYLIAHEALQDIISYSHSRLKVKLQYSDDPNIVVSKQKVSEFKAWLEGE